jgi:hypothetical protein
MTIPLQPGPHLLLIDSGRWQYRSQVEYYDLALRDLGYFADRWTIDSPDAQLPNIDQLKGYDAVIWSAPFDSPGYLGANDIITDYLDIGGRLLISGQNVGSNDGSHAALAVWWNRDLEGRWLADADTAQSIVGAGGTAFTDLALTLNGEDSAQNQITPDQVGVLEGALTQPVLYYPDGTAAALSANRCKPYRLLYLGFGLEGVSGRSNRAALMQASLETLLEPMDRHEEASWQPTMISDISIGGDRPVYTVTLHSLNRLVTQTFNIEATGGTWPRTVLTPTLNIGPCESRRTVVTLQAPPELPRGARHELTIEANLTPPAAFQTSPAVLTITSSAPGSTLLVDDDRFYQTEGVYRDALDQLGLTYDIWETGWADEGRGSPRMELLRAYDLVIWFTGYDWYEPLTDEEDEALAGYLDAGGRLFLSSQDYLGAHRSSVNPRDFFGLAGFQESVTPTQVFLDEREGLGALPGRPMALQYGDYQNYSDGLIPVDPTSAFIWHDLGAPAGTATSGIGGDGASWLSVFWAFPFETLPAAARTPALQAVIGQLSDVGDSEFTVDRRSAAPSEARTYTITATNSADQARRVWLTNTLPANLELPSVPNGFVFNRERRQLLWDGILKSGESRVFQYVADISSASDQSARIDNVVAIRSTPLEGSAALGPFDGYVLTKTATTWVGAPDLSGSTLSATSEVRYSVGQKGNPAPVQVITYTLNLRNASLLATGPMSATVSFPQSLDALEKAADATAGAVVAEDSQLRWEGIVGAGKTISASLVLTQTAGLEEILPAAAYINDSVTDPFVRPLFFTPLPFRSYWPLIGTTP